MYWKLQLAGRTTREQAVGGETNTTTQGETSASRNFPQTGHRTTDEEGLYLHYTLSVLWVARGVFRDLVQPNPMLSNMTCAVA